MAGSQELVGLGISDVQSRILTSTWLAGYLVISEVGRWGAILSNESIIGELDVSLFFLGEIYVEMFF